MGFIPFKKGDILRISPAFTGGNAANAINFFNGSFENIGQITDSGASYGICSGNASIYKTTVIDGVSALTYSDSFDSNIAYIRITHWLDVVETGANVIVTINEEIR